MDVREKLVELLRQSETEYSKFVHETSFMPDKPRFIADHLIANGVTVQVKPQTNADRIRAMTDEELAEFLSKFDPHCCNCPAYSVCSGCSSTPPRDCAYWYEEWIQQPVKEGAE